ncbi:hypothetical protein cypCar_00044663, partial [Cyprinus carpio]
IPQMLCLQSDPPVHTSFPSVHAFIMLEGTMNLTGETQPLVEQLMMIKRMQRIPAPLFVLEIWKACFTGLIESPEGNEELKWTAFTFLKIPQVLLRLKKYPQGEKTQDFMEDVNVAFENLLNLTPLLDKADQRCNCDCLSLLLQECNKLGLLSEANTATLTAKRSEDREHAPRLKTAENANIQPNPGLILRAEPTVTNILKTVDADHSKSPEGLLGVLGHMLSGKSLDLLLAAAAATGKLKSFARKFINTPAAILEVLNAWENGVLSVEAVQTGLSLRPAVEGQEPIPYRNLLPARQPILQALQTQFREVLEKGWVDSHAFHLFENLLHMGGVFWFTNNLVKELLKETRKEWASRVVELLYSIFCLDTQQITLTLLGHILPRLLTDPAHWHSLADPPGRALAKLSVWCALSSYSSHHKGQASAQQRKRQREDIEDYTSLFPLDDTQPSKLMRLLSSNEDETVMLSSPGDRSMSSSLSASQLHTVNMRDPLNRVLANLFLLISSLSGSKTAGPHTQFVQSFIEECVECSEQGSRGSILQFMPFTMISELVKLQALAKPKTVLSITDLSLPLGRRMAAKAIAAL